MVIVIRGNSSGLRTAMSFLVSAGIHGSVLAWVALGPVWPASVQSTSLYDQVMRADEHRIVWYNLRDRLPDVDPASAHKDARPPRARVPAARTVAAGTRDDLRPPQLIWMPAPELAPPRPLPLPNVVAVAPPPRLVRPFTPPVDRRDGAPAARTLPEAPRVASAFTAKNLPLAEATPVPRRAFAPPPSPKRPAPGVAQLPEAPRVASTMAAESLPFDASLTAPRRVFAPPPPAARPPQGALALPQAPGVTSAVAAESLPLDAPVAAPRRAFAPPPLAARPPQGALALPQAPGVASAVAAESLPIDAPVAAPRRGFTPPPESRVAVARTARLPAAPEVAPSPSQPDEATMAIVGLNPANATDFPKPPGSRPAGFSAGPKPRAEGGDVAGDAARLAVPGLLAREGSKDNRPTVATNLSPTSRENLLAAARLGHPPPAAPPQANVSAAPDPRLEGRVVYRVAIQMPNVTSYSGSWIVWFAEREQIPGGPARNFEPPMPLRKVDPKYIPAAAAERVEGSVRLFAVIRKDGQVDAVALVQHLDDRLDRSAEEALAKWEFQPARLDGAAVDVDAIFEIPFRLAPRSSR